MKEKVLPEAAVTAIHSNVSYIDIEGITIVNVIVTIAS